jgi:hypothetical protein
MSADDNALGSILQRMGAVTADALVSAAQQISKDRRLGAVLLSLGLITAADLDCALHAQKLFRKNRRADAAIAILDAQLDRARVQARREASLADAVLRA